MTDEFDDLREKSMRGNQLYNDVEGVDEGGGGFLAQFTPGQRLILALLLLANVVVIVLVLLSLAGIF
jgi:hypothetical protein